LLLRDADSIKNMSTKNRGFTLIELLIVVTILGLLSAIILVGLGGVRSQGRDTRRIADLRQVQNALEIYFNKNQTYPIVAGGDAQTRWSNLTTALTGAGIGVSAIARDPLNRTPYFYDYGASANGLNYVLKEVLENSDNPALKDDIDGSNILGTGIDCGAPPPATESDYCLQL